MPALSFATESTVAATPGTILANEPEWHGIDKMSVTLPPDVSTAPPLKRSQINIVEAINLVARVATAQIAYHQREIAAIQAALRPFHEAAVPPPATNGLDADDAINQLLTLAGRLSNAPTERQ